MNLIALGSGRWLALVVLIVGSTVAGLALWQTGVLQSDAPYLVEQAPPGNAAAISIAEAWDLAWPAALEWDNDAQLFELNSTGQYDPLDIEAGSDGRRRGWNAFFGLEYAGLLVQIFDGAVVRVMEVSAPSGRGRSALAGRPVVDSTEAVPRALAAVPDYTGSLDKTSGLYLALGTSEAGVSIISMSGQYRGQPASIQMDAATGDVIRRSAYLPAAVGGVLYSQDRRSDLACQ